MHIDCEVDQLTTLWSITSYYMVVALRILSSIGANIVENHSSNPLKSSIPVLKRALRRSQLWTFENLCTTSFSRLTSLRSII